MVFIHKSYGVNKMTKENYLLKEVISHFDFVGTLISCEPYGSGHINDTFLLEYKIRHMGVVPIIFCC